MSRFAAYTRTERFEDPAIRAPDSCDHPEEAATAHDSGGCICSPSFYCTACGRLVFLSDA